MPVYPIPDDWNGDDWNCVIIEWPDSPQWMGLLRGLVQTPVRGRFWDGSTGSIIDAQAIGLEIEERNPVTSCDAIVDQLALIVSALDNLDTSQADQITIQTNIQNNIDVVAVAIADSLALQSVALVAASSASAQASASAFAWSESFAQSLTPVTIINNTEIQFRPIDVTDGPAPTAGEATPTAITSVLQSTNTDEICKRAYWMVINAKEFFDYAQGVRFGIADTVLGALALAADGLMVAAFKPSAAGKAYLIPAAVVLNFAHALQSAFNENLDPLENLKDWLDDNYQDLVCLIAVKLAALESTENIREAIIADAISYGLQPIVANLALIIFNYSSLAALYYVSPLLEDPPDIPVSEPADICEFCDV